MFKNNRSHSYPNPKKIFLKKALITCPLSMIYTYCTFKQDSNQLLYIIQKLEYEDECEIPPLFCDTKSLACFQKPNLTFDYSDPYNNTFGEKKLSIIIGVLFFLTLSLMGMFIMVGIVCFERFALKNQRRLLLDMVSTDLKMVFLVNLGVLQILYLGNSFP